jgi:cytochrome P450
LANFIEETVRLESPFYGHFRVVTRDTELGGVPLPAGARLMVLWSSGNRDEAQFEDAGRFDPGRANLKAHLGFGQGIHYCVGAPLARLETRVALETLLARLPHVRLAAENDCRHLPSVFIRRLRALHLEFDRA